MKKVLVFIVYLFNCSLSSAQEEENIIAALEQQAETISETEEPVTQDESFIFQLENLKKHPVNLNSATAGDLQQLPGLTAIHVNNFLTYRSLFGNLLDIYEIQAVPGWNIELIGKILPFITVAPSVNIVESIRTRWKEGSYGILIRSSGLLEKAKGFTNQADGSNSFLGNAKKLVVRYSYNYRNLLQWGFSGDKDAGEPFFRSAQKTGFDFYAFHLFLSRLGLIKYLAIGDYRVNLGQGLVQWQSMAFSKSPEITSIKRQSFVLQPYTATGENGFHRGAAITLQKGNWETTIFLSGIKLSGNLVKDSISDPGHVSAILLSGYHRSPSEQEERNNLQQLAAGASVKFAADKWHVALNGVQYKFSLALQKVNKPYNKYAASGKNFRNASLDYGYTYRNLHFFGEMAIDKKYHQAIVSGMMASLSASIDFSLVYRAYNKQYHSFDTNAFSENTSPVNERGLYAGLCIRVSEKISINAYLDNFHFPWLKYRVDAPSTGKELYTQVVYNPNKQVELYSYFKSVVKQQNAQGAATPTNLIQEFSHKNWRLHSTFAMNSFLTVRSRAEIVFFNQNHAGEEGFLLFNDVLYKPPSKPWSGNIRLQYFETSGYNSRVYAFENDVLYSFSIPVFFDKGYRYYLNFHYDASKIIRKFYRQKVNAECWFRLAQTIYPGKENVGSGLDKIAGNKKTELKFQIVFRY